MLPLDVQERVMSRALKISVAFGLSAMALLLMVASVAPTFMQ